MRFRTLILALALATGFTSLASASTARKAVIHKTARKGKVRKGAMKSARVHKAKHGRTIKHV